MPQNRTHILAIEVRLVACATDVSLVLLVKFPHPKALHLHNLIIPALGHLLSKFSTSLQPQAMMKKLIGTAQAQKCIRLFLPNMTQGSHRPSV